MLAKIRSITLGLLARREHSKFELENKLSNKGFALEDIKEVLKEFVAQGLQSDHRFTESYIRMRSNKGFGPVRIKLELLERGLDKEMVGDFLASFDLDWFELARISWVKKFGEKAPVDFKEKAKQLRYLSYKGFNNEHINEIFNSL